MPFLWFPCCYHVDSPSSPDEMSDAWPSCPSQKPADRQPTVRKTAIQLTTDAGASSVKTTQRSPAKTDPTKCFSHFFLETPALTTLVSHSYSAVTGGPRAGCGAGVRREQRTHHDAVCHSGDCRLNTSSLFWVPLPSSCISAQLDSYLLAGQDLIPTTPSYLSPMF